MRVLDPLSVISETLVFCRFHFKGKIKSNRLEWMIELGKVKKTRLLWNLKYHCAAGLQFNRVGFYKTRKYAVIVMH